MKTIWIKIEFFKFFQKEYINNGKKGKAKWQKGEFMGFDKDEFGFWEGRIRINTLFHPITQIVTFIHESIHCILTFFQQFDYYKKQITRGEIYNPDLDIKREEELCYDSDKIFKVLIRRYLRKRKNRRINK